MDEKYSSESDYTSEKFENFRSDLKKLIPNSGIGTIVWESDRLGGFTVGGFGGSLVIQTYPDYEDGIVNGGPQTKKYPKGAWTVREW